MKRTLATLVAALCTTGLLAACGDDDGDPSSGGETTAETTSPEEGAGDDGPGRIVSMSASATEMLFAIGAGDQVVAADSFSNYPAEAPTTDLSAYEPNRSEEHTSELQSLMRISYADLRLQKKNKDKTAHNSSH